MLKNKKRIILLVMCFMILFINVTYSFAANQEWKELATDEAYKEALNASNGEIALTTNGYAGKLQELLVAMKDVNLKNLSQDDLQLYYDTAKKLVEKAEYIPNSSSEPLSGYISTVNKKKNDAKKILNGEEVEDDNQETEGSDKIPNDWINWYNCTPADVAEFDEYFGNEAVFQKVYELYVSPNDPDIDNMNDYFAEQFIINLGNIMGQTPFEEYMNRHPGTREELVEVMQIVANSKNIENDEARDIIERYGADRNADGSPVDSDSPIYEYPQKTSDNNNSEESLEDLIEDGESFLSKGSVNIDQTALQNFSKTMYNILLAIGVVVAVIIGALIGLNLMTASVEEKAEAKKLIIPYIVGCFIVFGGFGIWKIVITILQGI